MERINPKQATLLAKLFDEIEKCDLSESEKDEELKKLGIDPTKLVAAGQKIVKKFVEPVRRSIPIAAANGDRNATKEKLAKLLKTKKGGGSKGE